MILATMSEDFASPARRADGLRITDRELFERLGWFTKVRWAAGLFALLALLIGWHVLGVRFRTGGGEPTLAQAVTVVAVVFLYNAVFTYLYLVLRTRGGVTRRRIVLLALAQIVCDIAAVCSLAHATGGIENYFVIAVVLPIAIATELLPQALAYAAAGAAAVLINALAWLEQQEVLPHVHVDWAGGGAVGKAGLYRQPAFVLEATVALTLTIFAMVFIASTISRRLRLRETEVEEAYERLHAADETKTFFMRKAGHEMRAPLAAIHSILEAMGPACGGLSDQARRLVGRAQHRTRAMMALVDDLREYSRLRSPTSVLDVRRVCLGDIVKATCELFRQQAADAELELVCRAKGIWVQGDEELLREVVTNLVANAIQYTPSGGRIEVSLTARRRTAVLTVADTGIGISEADREHLFEEFFRSAAAKEVFSEGTGLGLSIIRRIVRMHAGDIEAAPRPEGGTVFTVHLPLTRRALRAGGPAV